MNLLITIDFPPETGGIQRYLHDRALHLYKWNDIIITGSSKKFEGQLPCKIFQYRIFSFFNKKFNLIPISFFLFVLLLKGNKYSIEAGNIYAAIPAFFLSFIFKNCRYSVICHGMEILQLQKKSLKCIFLKEVLKRSEQHIVVSKFTLGLIRKAGITHNHSYAPPRIDLPRCVRQAELFEKNHFQILSVGRFVPHKGHAILLEAASILPKTTQWRITIAGNGPLYKSLSENCKNKSLSARTTILQNPSRNELCKLYQEADLFIFPSLDLPNGTEGFGIVLLEAMAHQIPIIASDTGGIPEVVTPECAILIPPNDPQSLYQSIIELYEKPSLRTQLAQKAYERVKTHFSWK